MSPSGPSQPGHPMRVVIRKTGLTPDLLRAWEKRYQVVTPSRSAGGQRLYTTADVERLTLLKRATDLGRTIGRIAHLSAVELRELIKEDLPVSGSRSEAIRRDCFTAIERMDGPGLEALLRRAAVNLPLASLTDEVLAPLMVEVGDRWHAGTLRPAQEHLATATIRRVLFWAADAAAPPPGAPTLVVSTPSGQRHELGALLALATAAAAGWRVVYLGPDLPAADLADALRRTGASVLALSLVFPAGDGALAEELLTLRRLAAPGTTIIAGGKAVDAYAPALDRVGAIRCSSLDAFRATLGTLAPPAA